MFPGFTSTNPPILLGNRQNLDAYSLWKEGADPAMINHDHFFSSLLLQIKPVIMKTINFKFGNV